MDNETSRGSSSRHSLEQWLEFAAMCPLEFSIQYPPRPEYFQAFYLADTRNEVFLDPLPDLLYVHVPFCASTCSYCVFSTEARPTAKRMAVYIDALLCELAAYPDLLGRGVSCLDIGGGTPTLLPERDLARLLSAVSPLVREEGDVLARSIETTPEQIVACPGKVRLLRDHGFNRISMGVQTFAEAVLDRNGRVQHRAHVKRAAELIRLAKIPRLSIDLIFGLAGQTESDWQHDLELAVELLPDAITTYDCLYRGQGRAVMRAGAEGVPTPHEMGAMYDRGYQFLAEKGYRAAYGSLNFCRHGGETGTSRYFERRLLEGQAYLGLGAHATSLSGPAWRFNTRQVDDYLQTLARGSSPTEWSYWLPQPERWAKQLLFSLNFGRLDEDRFRHLFGRSLAGAYPAELALATQRGWLQADAAGYGVPKGQFSTLYQLRGLLYSSAAREWFRRWVR